MLRFILPTYSLHTQANCRVTFAAAIADPRRISRFVHVAALSLFGRACRECGRRCLGTSSASAYLGSFVEYHQVGRGGSGGRGIFGGAFSLAYRAHRCATEPLLVRCDGLAFGDSKFGRWVHFCERVWLRRCAVCQHRSRPPVVRACRSLWLSRCLACPYPSNLSLHIIAASFSFARPGSGPRRSRTDAAP